MDNENKLKRMKSLLFGAYVIVFATYWFVPGFLTDKIIFGTLWFYIGLVLSMLAFWGVYKGYEAYVNK